MTGEAKHVLFKPQLSVDSDDVRVRFYEPETGALETYVVPVVISPEQAAQIKATLAAIGFVRERSHETP